jgi:hypothetical protein
VHNGEFAFAPSLPAVASLSVFRARIVAVRVAAGIRVRDIDYLADMERRDRKPETGGGARQRGSGYAFELNGCVRSSYRALSIFGVNRAHQRRDEKPEQGQRQWVTNEVEKNESPAESAHVTNEVHQIAFAKVMAQVHGERDIGKRQRVVQCVGLNYRNWRGDTGVGIDVHANNFDPEPAPDLFQNETGGASHIQYSMDRLTILANGPHNQVCVTQPTVDSGEVPVCPCD